MSELLLDELLGDIVDLTADSQSLVTTIQYLRQELQQMSATLASEIDALKADVAAQTSAVQSAKTFITGLSTQLSSAVAAAAAAGATADQLKALSDLDASVKANTSDLAAAIVANTAVAPPTEPETPAPTETTATAVETTTTA